MDDESREGSAPEDALVPPEREPGPLHYANTQHDDDEAIVDARRQGQEERLNEDQPRDADKPEPDDGPQEESARVTGSTEPGPAEPDAPRKRKRSVGAIVGVALFIVGVAALIVAVVLYTTRNQGVAQPPAIRNLTFGVIDTFQRPDDSSSLGMADSGQRWDPVVGRWGISGGSAYISSPNRSGYNVAVVNMHTGDGSVQVTLSHVVAGCGLVFRWQNKFSYWFVVASPQVASWVVDRVDSGRVTTVGSLGLAAVRNDTTVGVDMKGPVIEVSINGQLNRSFTDPSPNAHQTWVGLTGFGESAVQARWNYLTASGESPTTIFGSPSPSALTTQR